MGFFGKLLFWRRKKKIGFPKEETRGPPLQDLPIPQIQPYDTLGMPQRQRPREQPYSPFEPSPYQQPSFQQPPQQADNVNIQVISSKLDVLNSKLDMLNQRLSQLEMQWQNKQQPRW